MKKFPSYRQLDEKDCGPACLKIILKYYGENCSLQTLITLSETTREGTSLLGLSKAAEKLNLRTLGVKLDYEKLVSEATMPCIAFWQQKHFVVIYKIKKNRVYISDPGHGLISYSRQDFLQNWASENGEGVLLLIEPTIDFVQEEAQDCKDAKVNLSFLWKYVFRYRNLLVQLLFSLLAGSAIQLVFPFLTQAIVDLGIQNQDLNFIFLVLLAQVMLFLGKTSLEIIRSWILLHVGSRVKISLVSDFFIKLMNLPISFFDSKMTGDIIQRITDHKRIERFLTVTSLNVLFSVINLVLFSTVLMYYNFFIFFIFFIGAGLYFTWAILFQNKRKSLDYKLFSQLSDEQTKVIELIQGMQEIKLHNAERQKRWSWEYIQAKIFKIEIKTLSLEQYQTVGASFINELKNILITVLAAKLVIEGELTLGMMLSISYIIGQLNAPLVQMIEFLRDAQNAKISLERLMTIHQKDNEENVSDDKISDVDYDADIIFNNVSFRYTGSREQVLHNINLTLPAKKITAIVGSSGSGKTTLMKLLLKIYDPESGEILINNTDMRHISPGYWRKECGVVMQEGYIFNDTIANNIALGESQIDKKKLHDAIKIANVKSFTDELPLGLNTKIGTDGVGLSTGQKQRILIARAVYKDPKFILLDEATSALDANNEKIIIQNLNRFFTNRTVVVIAHRLSTVKNADQIVVIEKGQVVETGNHESLLKSKGSYYNLVKNQLQLEELNRAVEYTN